MSQDKDEHSILDDAWSSVVGGMDWLKSVLFGEFADNRPLSAVVADMLVSFVPGVVIVTSARDAVAVILRMASHPEKREDIMEWVLLSACLIVIALPLAMAAGGAAAAGVGAIVGGLAGSELGAALRSVMLLLIKEASKLVELVRFLQKFIKGDVMKFLRAVKFAPYEKALMAALRKFSGKLLSMVKSLRVHLESLSYFNVVKHRIAILAEWERKFYAVQQEALNKIPKALAELDARLAKVLAEAAPQEAHTASAGVQASKAAPPKPPTQRVRDTPGQVLPKETPAAAPPAAPAAKSEALPARPGTKPAGKPAAKPAAKTAPKAADGAGGKPPLKDKPDPVDPAKPGPNGKKQAVVDAAAAADRARITQLSNEADAAAKAGDQALAAAKLEEARSILRPYLPKNPGDSWDEVVKRLDVSSPKDGAVFWSGTSGQASKLGQVDAARAYAEKIGGVTLETTPGGRIIDGWDDVNKAYPWNASGGQPGPYASGLWGSVSEKYANGASGVVNVVQTPEKLWDAGTVWHNSEKPLLMDLKKTTGQITDIKMHVVDLGGQSHPLSDNYIGDLLKFDQRKP
ncbi:hypothetical protein [Herbaspirillum seropedicae]|uniref:hypothetical protein n=1 Tax=Herbaspirillum seropedicae TaxID=964 RepID=UPI003FCC5D93